MGLLDEAIREHLELKRRSGGDPTEIAHQEQEALDPVFPEAAAPAGELPADGRPDEAEEPPAPAAEADLADEYLPDPPAPAADFSSVGQETAELDMRAVLDADSASETANGDPLGEPGPGQERLDFE